MEKGQVVNPAGSPNTIILLPAPQRLEPAEAMETEGRSASPGRGAERQLPSKVYLWLTGYSAFTGEESTSDTRKYRYSTRIYTEFSGINLLCYLLTSK